MHLPIWCIKTNLTTAVTTTIVPPTMIIGHLTDLSLKIRYKLLHSIRKALVLAPARDWCRQDGPSLKVPHLLLKSVYFIVLIH